jgi:hypothetical protein
MDNLLHMKWLADREDPIVKQFLQNFDKIEVLSACIDLHEIKERTNGKEQNPLRKSSKLRNIKIGDPAPILLRIFMRKT